MLMLMLMLMLIILLHAAEPAYDYSVFDLGILTLRHLRQATIPGGGNYLFLGTLENIVYHRLSSLEAVFLDFGAVQVWVPRYVRMDGEYMRVEA